MFLFVFILGLQTACASLGEKQIKLGEDVILPSKKTIQKEIIIGNVIKKLVGSNNPFVVRTNGQIFTPLTDSYVNLLYKIRLNDSTEVEEQNTVLVKAQNSNTGTNPKPFVIPSLREWQGGIGKFTLTKKSRIVIAPNYKDNLSPIANVFQNDLKSLCNNQLKIVSGLPRKGDIYLTLDANVDELKDEGYYLTITNFVSISAAKYRGAFWATRTVLQLLEQSPCHHLLPRGIARDYPKYEVRGFMLDVGRKYFTIDYLRDMVKLLAYYKMSNFHLHLSDNAFVGHYNNNWDSTYCGFRLENSTYPQLPTKGEFYTKKQFIDLQKLAEQYAMDIIPEVDVPAHSLPFTRAFPNIASKKYGKDHLDLTNPDTYTIIENVFKEYIEGDNPVFRAKEVHIGTDEYAKESAEDFRKFTDHFIKFVKSYGKNVRLWGALTHAKGTTPVTSEGVTMNAWYNGYADPSEMKKLGYKLIGTPDGLLYIVPAAGYYYDYLNLPYLYKKWEPTIIGEQIFQDSDPTVRGGMFAVWNDVAKNGITAHDITDRVFPALQVLSEKMWSGTDTTVTYNAFRENAKKINESPDINLRAKLKPTHDSLVYHRKQIDIIKKSENKIRLPFDEIGYDYTVSFSLFPEQGNVANSVLFNSKHATFKLKQGSTTNIGFSHEGKQYDFGIQIPEGKWSHIVVEGDNNSTTMFVDGKRVKELKREKVWLGFGKDSIYQMRTLVFPLNTIGDGKNSFVGKMRDLKIFNRKLNPCQVKMLSGKNK